MSAVSGVHDLETMMKQHQQEHKPHHDPDAALSSGNVLLTGTTITAINSRASNEDHPLNSQRVWPLSNTEMIPAQYLGSTNHLNFAGGEHMGSLGTTTSTLWLDPMVCWRRTFEPYIADFGLAKLVEDREFGRCSNTVAGSYEYGYSMKITEKSDVYSYGVVMLEVLTGKQPIDPTIPDGVHLVDWVRRRKGSSEVLDLVLRGRPDTEVEEMLQAIGVALLCVSPTPEERPTMKDVAAMLKEIRLEREEYAKVDVLLKGTSPLPATVGLNATTSGANSISGNKSNCSSFSGSTTVYSTSNAKSPFGYYLLTSPSQNVATDLNYVFLDSIDASFAHHKLRRSRSLNCQILPTLSSLVLEDT